MKNIINFIKDFLLGYFLAWYALDLWILFHGDLCPLWRKGINVEWIINTKQSDLSESVEERQTDRRTYIGFRVTYTYNEPTIIRNLE